jgi:DNA-binding CsgD family transcriptional regulator
VAKTKDLRPLERRILALKNAGEDDAQIGRRFKRSPDFISRVTELARLDGRHAGDGSRARGLRPLERRVIDLRDRGVSRDELARRFKRSPDHVARVEKLARYKLARPTR